VSAADTVGEYNFLFADRETMYGQTLAGQIEELRISKVLTSS
jgi:hypothetical protein